MKIIPTYIDEKAATVDIPYPEGEPAHLNLQIPAGKVRLEPGAGDSICSGKVTYNVAELKPTYAVKGRTVRIRQQYKFLIPLPGKLVNKWDFLLGTANPYSLEVEVGASEARLDFGGLPLTVLAVKSGAGDLQVDFSAANPTVMAQGKIAAGAGRTQIKGLLNANAESFKIEAGVGQMIVHFTGEEPSTGGQFKISGGMGEIELVLDEDAPIRVKTSMGLGGINADEDLIKVKGGYETDSYADSAHRIDIEVSSGVGAIKIELA
jgi:hypothetical protein